MKFDLGLQKTLKSIIQELMAGLKRLDFINNFDSFETTQTIEATTEAKIRNGLDPAIPTRMLITKQTGNAVVTAGPTAWTSDWVYVKNHSANTAVVTIVFFRN